MARPEILTKFWPSGPRSNYFLIPPSLWAGVVFSLGSPPKGRTGGFDHDGKGSGPARRSSVPGIPRRSAAFHWRSYCGAKSPRVRAREGRASSFALPPSHRHTHTHTRPALCVLNLAQIPRPRPIPTGGRKGKAKRICQTPQNNPRR